ncbi:efflux RND transporter periplasmic adaptor subunit [Terrihabitans sp. B22-R8]|uniref:efflux RND transporter periplasmic adaptor subunit n=1 Tax=Terrihabitans sp. B22-R8 TaxID=3425128 RepID=UPI00403C9E33
MRKSFIALTALLLAGAGGYAAMRWQDRAPMSGQVAAQANAAPATESSRRPSPVEVATSKSVPAVAEFLSVGTLTSDESVSVAAEVAGRVAALQFQEGQTVKAGDVLVKLDDALARAEVTEAEAGQVLAQANFQRASTLSRSGAGTTRALDEAKAALATSAATIELAKVRLEKTEIRAPFDGVVGLRAVSPGAYAQIGQALVNLEKIDALKLDFRLPEINLRDVSVGMKVEITADAFPGETFEGSIYAIDPQVDVNGRAIRIRARVANEDGRLRPGLFARVKVRGAARGDVVTIPEGAVVPRGNETIVYMIQGGKAEEARVTLGRRWAGSVEILEGLKPEIMVVTAGQARLKNGASVEVIDTAGPV